ncbi:retrovirus-related pol polyprotein from transposon TNT 1-94 [Tanacetum coccineum]
MHRVQVQLVMGELRIELGMQIQVKQGKLSATTTMVALDEEQLLFIAGGQDVVVDEDVDEQPVQDLALNVDNVFQANDSDAFDFDVDEAPTAQTMFMANLSSADLIYNEACLSYDSDILSEVHDNDHYQDVVCEHHEVHEMHDDVQLNYIVDSHTDYTSDINMIPYDQNAKDNTVPVVQSNSNVVDNSLTAELVTYKEQVELYERRAKFELTEREQKINEQLRIVIADRNRKEENLKRELHSVKLQLTSTINHNKSMVEEVTSLKKDFKQKENKYLEEFLDMKALKEKVKDKLYKQDQSLQTVHMLCKPKPYYDEQNKVAIGYKNPLCLTRAKQVQPALYNFHETIKTNHVPTIVHNSEDTLEIAEITRKKINDKMKDPEYAIDVEPITPRNRNNREVHLDYLKHLKESVETLHEIVEEAKVESPLDGSLAFACLYTKHSQELKKQVTFEDQCETSNSNTHKHVEKLNIQKTNVPVSPSTRVNSCTDASGSQPRSNTKKNRILLAKSVNKKKVKEHPRTNKSSLKTTNRVDSSISSKRTVINLNSRSVCNTCNKCFISENHDMYVVNYLNSVKASPLVKNVVRKVKQIWIPKQVKQVVQIVLWYLDSGCSKHMMGDRSWLRNFMKKFTGTVRFRNDHFGAIMGYGDYVIGDSVISRVYYVEGLGHNLFSIRKFCDSDLEVAFRKHSCYVHYTNGVELIKGSHCSNLYTISVEDMMKSSPICLLSKASKNKSWLWHRRLNHLNFGTINDLARKDLVRGLPRLKFEKDHLCSACQLGQSKKHTHTPKAENTNLEVLNTLHIDLCGPMQGVATACYTQNRSLIHTRHNKTSYELVHDKKPDLTLRRRREEERINHLKQDQGKKEDVGLDELGEGGKGVISKIGEFGGEEGGDGGRF